jgi:transcriptional regulator with XRE-family HTH domain
MKQSRAIFAFNVRQLRQLSGMSQKTLAKKARISLRTFQKIETASGNPTLETILLIAETLGVSPHQLLQLTVIKLTIDFELFLNRFKSIFVDESASVGLRTTQGLSIWTNQTTTAQIPNQQQWPLHLKAYYEKSPDLLQVVSAQLEAEQMGIARPYIAPTQVSPAQTREHYRVYPVLITPKNASTPQYTVVLAMKVLEEKDSTYCQFCKKLFQCIEEVSSH